MNDKIFEIWKDINGYVGLYQISNFGNVKSLSRYRIWRNEFKLLKEKTLKAALNGRGYLMVILSKNKKRENLIIHRLVAEAFIPNTNNLPQVNHRNGIKTDNRVENLEWCTSKENNIHARKIKLNNCYGENCVNSKLLEKQILEIREKYLTEKISQRKLGDKYNVTHKTIFDIVSRKTWKHL